MRWIKRMFRIFFPCHHDWQGFESKYGYTWYCRKCGITKTTMSRTPWGD